MNYQQYEHYLQNVFVKHDLKSLNLTKSLQAFSNSKDRIENYVSLYIMVHVQK